MPPSAPRKATGRPSRERAAEISDLIVDATIALFSEHGMEFSMDQVAAAAGISKQAIYRRWPGKVDLLIHAVNRGIERENSALRAGHPAEPLAALRELAWRRFHHGGNQRHRFALFIQVEAMRDARLHQHLLEWHAQHMILIAHHVAAVTGDDGRDPAAADLAQILVDLLDGAGALSVWHDLSPAHRSSLFDQRWATFTAILERR